MHLHRVSLSPFRFIARSYIVIQNKKSICAHNNRRDRRLAIRGEGKNLHRESKNKSFCAAAARFESGASAPKVVHQMVIAQSLCWCARRYNGATIFYANARRTMNKENWNGRFNISICIRHYYNGGLFSVACRHQKSSQPSVDSSESFHT
jgi:hypothetical protein